MTKRTILFLMIVCAVLAVVFCLLTIQASLQGSAALAGYDTTATYGAEQFHLQLTAQAEAGQ